MEYAPLGGRLSYGLLDSLPGKRILEIDWDSMFEGRVLPANQTDRVSSKVNSLPVFS